MNTKKTVAIVQARMGSTRLPLKSLLCLRGHPLIDWVTTRLGRAATLDKIVVALPDTELDKVLREHLERNNVACFAGSENDVLDRFRQAANFADADTVVRVCADNPLISPQAVDELVAFYKKTGADYAYNHIPRGNLWPDGLGAEILSRDLLEKISTLAKKPPQREHCLNYIWDNRADFKILTFDPREKWLQRPDLKLDIDSPEDFKHLASLAVTPETDDHELIRACDAAWGKPA